MTENTITPDHDMPYVHLMPDCILDAVESVGFRCTGSLLALNSYENRVYQIGIDEAAPIVAKFYRPHRWSTLSILEEHHFAQTLSEHEIPVVAPWRNVEKVSLHQFSDFNFALFPRWGGHALELDSLEHLERMGRFLGRIHAVGASRPFQHRAKLTVERFGYDAIKFLSTTDFIPDYIKTNFFHEANVVLNKIDKIFQSIPSIKYIRLHGDLHAGNVLWDESGPHILDFDDCLMGPAIQDLWMLLSGDEEQMALQMEYILRGYLQFHDFNRNELYLIEALRTLRQLNYSAWLARRWDDPAFSINFPWFNTPFYWEECLQNLQEQNGLLDRSPLHNQ